MKNLKKLIYDIKLESAKLGQKNKEELELKISEIKKRATREPLEELIPEWFALIQEISFQEIV